MRPRPLPTDYIYTYGVYDSVVTNNTSKDSHQKSGQLALEYINNSTHTNNVACVRAASALRFACLTTRPPAPHHRLAATTPTRTLSTILWFQTTSLAPPIQTIKAGFMSRAIIQMKSSVRAPLRRRPVLGRARRGARPFRTSFGLTRCPRRVQATSRTTLRFIMRVGGGLQPCVAIGLTPPPLQANGNTVLNNHATGDKGACSRNGYCEPLCAC